MKNQINKLMLVTLFLTEFALGVTKPITVHVNGMVCAFCAQGITKKLKTLDGVEKIVVSLEKKIVTFELPENSTASDEQIKTLITQAGMNVESIER